MGKNASKTQEETEKTILNAALNLIIELNAQEVWNRSIVTKWKRQRIPMFPKSVVRNILRIKWQ
jgi:hypothetical protein